MVSHVRPILAAMAVVAALGVSQAAAAQGTVTAADIERLQDSVLDASRDISRLRSTNPSEAARLERELDDLRDEVVYLRVKVRRNEAAERGEYTSLRDRLDDLRARARGDVPSAGPQTGSAAVQDAPREARSVAAPGQIPVGQELDVRLQVRLNSGDNQVEDRFDTTTIVDLYQGDAVLVPAGSVLRGVVSQVDRAGRADRKGSLTLNFDEMIVRGRAYPIRASVTQAIESEGVRGEVGRIATGSAIGAIIGGIIGGGQGVLAGILIGGGGSMVALPGREVDVPPGTILRVRFDAPVSLGR